MIKHYHLNKKLLRGLLIDNFKMIAFLAVGFPIYWKLRHGSPFLLESEMIVIFCVLIIVINIPPILLYLNYYFRNRYTSFSIDFDSQKIAIHQNRLTKEYSFKDIESSIYHLGIYHKNVIDKRSRRPIFISDFGYWDLTFKNGDRFFLTNLLHNFLHDAPFVANTNYRFRLFPYISQFSQAETLNLKQEVSSRMNDKTNKFILRFEHKDTSELKTILANKSKYRKEAIEAAGIILTRRESNDSDQVSKTT